MFLIRLYPTPWRARYGEEFQELLLARPPTLRDRLDIVRGAIDARINLGVGESRPPRVVVAADRILALAAVAVGALLSIWSGVFMIASPRWGEMDSVDGNLLATSHLAGVVGSVLAVVVLAGVARRHADDLGPVGALGAWIAAAGFLATNMAGPLGLLLLTTGTMCMGAGLARAFGLVVSVLLSGATLLLAAGMLGFAGSGGQDVAWLWLLAGYGPTWMLLGAALLRGGHALRRPA